MFAQSNVDVTALTADTKTFIFSDGKHTVKQYIYDELKGKTTCCGSDRIYLEVKIDPSGYVMQAKTLTGKNECYKLSAIDIVKNIKWNTKDFKGPRSVYFEIKPELGCEDDSENEYKQIALFNNEILDKDGNPVANASAGPPSTKSNTAPEPPKEAPAKPTVDKQEEEVFASAEKPTRSDEKPDQGTPKEETAPKQSNNSLANALDKANEEKTSQVSEAERLKQEAEALKLKEQEDKERELARKAEIERKRAEILAKRKAQQDKANQEGGGDNGGKATASSGKGKSGKGGGGGKGEPEPPKSLSPEERLRQELAALEEKKTKKRNDIRGFEDVQRRSETDQDRAENDLSRIEDEISRKKEEIERQKEDNELDRIRKKKREAEEKQRDFQRKLDDLMGQLRQIQQQADRQQEDLNRQQAEVENIGNNLLEKEQEITFNRETRKKDTDAAAATPSNETEEVAVVDRSTDPFTATFSAEQLNDTNVVNVLLAEIQSIRRELQRIQSGLNSGTPSSYNPVVTTNRSTTPATNPTYTNPQSSSGGGTVYNQKANIQYTSTGEKEPDPSHADTYVNVQGPQFSLPEYEQGSGGMKMFIKQKLREGGVCGLAQSFAEVTLDQNGKVIDYRIFKANKAEVSNLLPEILESLRFTKESVALTRVAYIEFKAEIICDPSKDSIDLNTVKDYIITD